MFVIVMCSSPHDFPSIPDYISFSFPIISRACCSACLTESILWTNVLHRGIFLVSFNFTLSIFVTCRSAHRNSWLWVCSLKALFAESRWISLVGNDLFLLRLVVVQHSVVICNLFVDDVGLFIRCVNGVQFLCLAHWIPLNKGLPRNSCVYLPNVF